MKGLSIGQKLPLVIGALLLSVILALTAAAWVEVRGTARRSAAERLQAVTTQFRDLFAQSIVSQRQLLRPLATHPAIREFIRNAGRPDAALRAMREIQVQPEAVVLTEIRTAGGRVLLSTARDVALSAVAPSALNALAPPDSSFVGPLRLVRDTLVYPVAARVSGSDSVYVVRWRRMAGSRRTREALGGLVGSAASIYLGNASGSEWSDLEHPVRRPAWIDGDADHGRDVIGASAPIDGTPWMVAVAFPSSLIAGRINAFLGRMALIAAIALVLGLLAAWALSRRITAPLAELTDAAEAMAAGLYGQQLRVHSRDELGRLARSFSSMSAEVQRTNDNLEQLVKQRTQELNETLTRLRDTQDALVRRERLAMLGQLSSGVGHELRNPLGVMTNSVYFLKAVLTDAPPRVREYLDILQQQITLSEKIVSDLLDFARSKPPQRRSVPVRSIVEEQIGRLPAHPGTAIAVEIPDEIPNVLVDAVQVGQIVFNLLTNAIQAMDGQGQVRVEAAHDEGRIRLEVSDTGPGIAPENLEKVFEPLYSTKARGIGLGLAVSRTLARANGGDLVAGGTPGAGAVFTLTLVSAAEHDAPAEVGAGTTRAAGLPEPERV